MWNVRKYNRYPLSNSFMLLGLIIAFCAVICGSTIFQNIENGKKESKDYKYESESILTCFNSTGKALDIKAAAEYDDINTEIVDVAMVIGKYTRVTTIAYSYNEQPPYRLLEGRFPSDEEIKNNKKVVNVGRDLLEDVYERNGAKYIAIDGIEYEVIGIFGSETSDILDSLVYFVYDCLDDFHKNIVNNCEYLVVRYGSDYTDVGEKITELSKNSSDELSIQVESSNAFSITSIDGHEKDTYYFLIYAFAVGICVIISELWIFERKDEIAILKTFGLKTNYIMLKIYKSILGIVSIALLTSYIIIFIASKITGDKFISASGFVLVVAAILITSLIIFILPMLKLERIEPARGINARGNY